jgi:hypothetical protein
MASKCEVEQLVNGAGMRKSLSVPVAPDTIIFDLTNERMKWLW